MSTIKYSFAAGAAVVTMLTACGDDVTNVTEVEKASLDIVEKYKELPKCEDSLYGTLIYAADSSQVYACTSDGWASLKGEKGDQGDDGLDGEDGKNGTNGTNGKDGEDGADGADGESCTATALKDGSGMEVKCGGKTVGVISNGTNGTDGEDGTNCNIVSDEGGVVTIQCGEGENAKTTELYKAVCGKEPFDPADKFCYAAELYDLCGDKVYDPSEEICLDGTIYPQCGGNAYDPEKQFCAKFADNTEQVYKMVTIAPEGTGYSETWMAENLNYETANSWCGGGSGTTEGDCAKYGRLYTWAAAVGKTEEECGYGQECNLGTGDIRGICPTGWHLPSQDEWKELIVAVDDNITEYTEENVAGNVLKSQTGWTPFEGINNEDAFGFSALPAGNRYNNANHYEGNYAYFWSSSEYSGYGAVYMGLYYRSEYAYLDNGVIKGYGNSVRCLRD